MQTASFDAAPSDRFGGVLFIEKEGFGPLLEAAGIAERFDVAIASTKGMTVVAFRRLLDALAAENPALKIYTLTDFDVTGMGIRHWVTASGRRYTFEYDLDVTVIGLSLEDARRLQAEGLHEPGGFTEPAYKVAERLSEEYGVEPEAVAFLTEEERRVELNALSSDELVALIEAGLADQPKVIPSADKLAALWAEAKISAKLAEVEARMRAEGEAKPKPPTSLAGKVAALLDKQPHLSWDAAVRQIARR